MLCVISARCAEADTHKLKKNTVRATFTVLSDVSAVILEAQYVGDADREPVLKTGEVWRAALNVKVPSSKWPCVERLG